MARRSVVAYLPQQNVREMPVFSVKDSQCAPTSSIKRGSYTEAKRHGQHCDETREAKYN